MSIRDSLIREPQHDERRVFLGGAAPGTQGALRDRVAEGLRRTRGRYWWQRYHIYYPETLFDGLMAGPARFDLLTLENILAQAVDAVVLIVESAGSLTELGAFANHEVLRQKLVVVQDERYRTKKSFIRHGPIRLLEDRGVGAVEYIDFSDPVSELAIDRLKRAISRVVGRRSVTFDLGNIFNAHHFVVPCLFVLEYLTRQDVNILLQTATQLSESKARVVATAALGQLIRERKVVALHGTFRLTPPGVREFFERGGWRRSKPVYDRSAIDQLRVSVLTRERRGRRKVERFM